MIGIIDYKAGNAKSVLHAVKYLGYEAALVRRPEGLEGATHIILPGVGSAGATMTSLLDMGMLSALEKAVLHDNVLFLGVCVGMQILFEHSEEENTRCLGWLKGDVVRFDSTGVRVPQMGWNKVSFIHDAPCPAEDDYFYFVNSYHARPADAGVIWCVADYNGEFTAAVHKDNLYATQFHIEKSGEAGLALLKAFLGLKGGR